MALDALTGQQVTPQWMKDDVTGTWETLQGGAEYVKDFVLDADTRSQAWTSVKEGVGTAWNAFLDDPWYSSGGVAFEVATWLVGVGEVKAGLTAAKGAGSFLAGVKAFSGALGKATLANLDDIGRQLARLYQYGDDATRLALQNLKNLVTTPATTLSRWGDDAYRVISQFSDDVLAHSPALKGLKEELAYATGSVSDDFGRHTAQVYTMSNDVAEGLGKTTQQASQVSDEFVEDIITDGSHMVGKKLKPNVVYQVGEHKYLYQTDDFGRISRAHADDLQLKLHDGRLRHNSNTPDKLSGDHAGHIFGDLFGGSPELDNLISQARDVNLKEYRRIEQRWSKALNSTPPKKVEVDIKINYDGVSQRPINFEVNYKIDGMPRKEIIKNINK